MNLKNNKIVTTILKENVLVVDYIKKKLKTKLHLPSIWQRVPQENHLLLSQNIDLHVYQSPTFLMTFG